MLLTRIILKDYGVYRGRNEFDFTCTKDKPIILIGGTNGAGKTTLFESIVLCFYGINMGKKLTTKAYDDYLAKKIHRYTGGAPAESTSVTVQFKFFHNGKDTEYQVERSWENTDKIHDKLTIKKRHCDKDKFVELDSIEENFWQSFIEDLIPRGIAKLFFFDGEKIAEIAEEESEDVAIKTSFNALLGLYVVMQLGADLQTNLMKNLTTKDKTVQQEIAKHTKEKNDITSLIDRLRERLVQKKSEINRINSDIEELDDKIAKIGGQFANKRQESKSRLESKTLAQEDITKRIQDMCGSILPLCLIPKRLKKLEAQLKKDEDIQVQKLAQGLIKSKIKELDKKLKSDSFWSEFGFESHGSEIRSKIISSIKPVFSNTAKKSMFGFSQSQTSSIIHMINESKMMLPKLEKETKALIEINEELTRIQTSITNAPTDDEIGPAISKLKKLNTQAGSLQAEVDHIESEISSSESMLKHLNVKLRSVVSQKYKNKKAKVKAELTEKVQNVLDEYVKKLKYRKLKLLEQYLLEAIKILMHKRNLVDKVSIDPETFEVTLYRENEEPLAKDVLSKGEKQMFATAVLWALAKTSGRPLPFIIDTPLARLDRKHRDNMVRKFFPLASHQTIIFSTDTEIEQRYYKDLVPYTTRSYMIEFVHNKGQTKVHEGYFWNKKEKKIIASR